MVSKSLLRELAVVGALTAWQRLRFEDAGEALVEASDKPGCENGVAPADGGARRAMVIEERTWMQSLRRSFSGDGRFATLTYLRELLDEARAQADGASMPQADSGFIGGEGAAVRMFDRPPADQLRALILALRSAQQGIDCLSRTTYRDSDQVVTRLKGLGNEYTEAILCIETFLAGKAPGSVPPSLTLNDLALGSLAPGFLA